MEPIVSDFGFARTLHSDQREQTTQSNIGPIRQEISTKFQSYFFQDGWQLRVLKRGCIPAKVMCGPLVF